MKMKIKLTALSALAALTLSAPAYASYAHADFAAPGPSAGPSLAAPAPAGTSSGFAWDDAGIGAGIGAGSMLAAVIAAAGSRSLARRRRGHGGAAQHAAA
jgi:hypothetical protein